ncbi:hypothetical protein [Sphingosinicella sp. CPCC 101087]|uniref:hypothetical protein n=1 Tax=Sphingosinicella sp. CPCC 101087 TaxID=2497754 RepID=UPI0013EBB7F0|nr:hypothetical protein [Sphingosinicella sp. CPCC 101087]
MSELKQRDASNADQADEIEASQEALRRSIAESRRLIEQAAEITRRHRRSQEERGRR